MSYLPSLIAQASSPQECADQAMSEYEIRDRAAQSIVGFIWTRSAGHTWFPVCESPSDDALRSNSPVENGSFTKYASVVIFL